LPPHCIVAISLVVGGIVIMNIMHGLRVTERDAEIGIRKAMERPG